MIPEFVKTPQATRHKVIEISAIVRGEGATIARFTVKVGAIQIAGVELRRGRGNATYVNYPGNIKISQTMADFLESRINAEVSAALLLSLTGVRP